ELLDFLDARVGQGRYVLALSADHGVCPLPEAARRRGEKAARIDPGPLWKKAEEHLSRTFQGGKPGERSLEKVVDSWAYLTQARRPPRARHAPGGRRHPGPRAGDQASRRRGSGLARATVRGQDGEGTWCSLARLAHGQHRDVYGVLYRPRGGPEEPVGQEAVA